MITRFNRNIVECKGLSQRCVLSSVWSFNRNIVECKAMLSVETARFEISFNRNIVECKDKKSLAQTDRKLVLIETLWNVKATD